MRNCCICCITIYKTRKPHPMNVLSLPAVSMPISWVAMLSYEGQNIDEGTMSSQTSGGRVRDSSMATSSQQSICDIAFVRRISWSTMFSSPFSPPFNRPLSQSGPEDPGSVVVVVVIVGGSASAGADAVGGTCIGAAIVAVHLAEEVEGGIEGGGVGAFTGSDDDVQESSL